jgi:alpha-L-fucosidase
MNREMIPFDEYRDQYAAKWKAEDYDPEAWAELACEAGMKYAVIVTRHHDGFCLWPTQTNEWNVGKIGPGRDLIRPFVDAFRKRGLRVGFYYSGADWSHPDYPSPYSRDFPPAWPDEVAHHRFLDQCAEQLRELMTSYGEIDILWWDGCMPKPFDPDGRLNRLVRELQPKILINERNGEPWDFSNCEQKIAAKPGAWEACMTLDHNWGWFDTELGYKSAADVVRMLVMTGKDGGNLLLNVGPKPDGTLPEKAVGILREVGGWLKENGAWLYGSDRTPFSWVEANCWLSTKGNRVYVHLLKSLGTEVCIAEIKNRILSAKTLHNGAPVKFESVGARLFLRGLPKPNPNPCGIVVELEVEGMPEPLIPRGVFWIPD